MNDYRKPIPQIQPWSAPFWEGTKKHELLIQECAECGARIFYPRKYCPECWSSNMGWSRARGRGRIYSHTTTMTGVETKFLEDLPFVLAIIDLDEGVRMTGNVVDCDPDDVSIGMEVEVVFDDVTSEITLPKWRPVKK
ncbi:MAG: Zn-ribbon domain-containing OB-fold protein [Desulfomonilaceae bacterium]|nr:Zn-ribbon domain-containing OB-fold protein [Desulfomonilaceae bacterium]